jgi:hypothetical protein
MSDTIGKCECINHSDKFEIDQVISDDIDELNVRLTRTRNTRQEIIEFGADPDIIARKYESEKSRLKNLLVRVRNTPECKS